MKRSFLLFCFVWIAFLSQGQSFRYGLKAGANYADINGKDLDKNEHRYKLGWHGGVMLNIQYPGNTYFSIQPELLYTRKGYENNSLPTQIHDNQGNLLYSRQNSGLVKLNYLELPVMFNFKSGIIVFEIGPQLSYLVGVQNDAMVIQTLANGSKISSPDASRMFTKDQVRKFDAGFATGFRLETSNGVGMGLRFNQGFLKINKSGDSEPAVPNGYNQVFQLFASYLIPDL